MLKVFFQEKSLVRNASRLPVHPVRLGIFYSVRENASRSSNELKLTFCPSSSLTIDATFARARSRCGTSFSGGNTFAICSSSSHEYRPRFTHHGIVDVTP